MSNKRGGIATEEIFGMLTFVFAAVIMMLLFYGCKVREEVVEYEQFELSKAEIQGTKDINSFLLMEHPKDSEKLILDLVIESYLADDYDEFDILAGEYFKNSDSGYNSKLYLWIDEGGKSKYEIDWDWRIDKSKGVNTNLFSDGIELPVDKGKEDMEFIEIKMSVWRRI